MFFDQNFNEALGLMLFLLNPFLLIIYLLDMVEELDSKTFAKVLLRATLISTPVYIIFALFGDLVFKFVFQSNFASFQIFGGIIFLITGLRFVFQGKEAIKALRGGNAEHVSGGIVMPIMIGPGTISASIVVGQKLNAVHSISVILLAVVICVISVILLKRLYDNANSKSEKLVARYIDIAGRVGALLIGTFSIEMIMNGINEWVKVFTAS